MVTERLASQGFSVVHRARHEGGLVRGLGGSYLVVTEEELSGLRDLSKQVETARRKAQRSHASHISEPQRQKKDQNLQSLREIRTTVLGQLRDQFMSRILSVVSRAELIQEDYFTFSTAEESGSTNRDPVEAAEATGQIALPEELEDWELVPVPAAPDLEEAGAGPSF